MRVTQAPAGPCGLAIRVPSWSSEPRLLINGAPAEDSPTDRGYLLVHRQGQSGDVLAWTFAIAPRWAFPHRRIDAIRGCAAMERCPTSSGTTATGAPCGSGCRPPGKRTG